MGLVDRWRRSFERKRAASLPFPALGSFRGAAFLLDPANWIDNRLLAGIPFEEAQLDRATVTVRRQGIDTVIDIGANFGLYSVILGRLPQVRHIIAFEPVARSHAQLLGNAFANRLADKLESHRLACGAEPGEAIIHIDPASTGVSRIDLRGTHRDPSAFRETETIRVARFDDIVAVEGRVCFVKIDVEGQAAAVLGGMRRFLAANRAFLQVEMIGSEAEAARAILAEAGYSETGMIENDGYFARV